jgi:hypothetical protein
MLNMTKLILLSAFVSSCGLSSKHGGRDRAQESEIQTASSNTGLQFRVEPSAPTSMPGPGVDCAAIARDIEIARAHALDTKNLEIIRNTYCAGWNSIPTSGLIPASGAKQDCIDMTLMLRLAILTAPHSPEIIEIQQLRQLVCVGPMKLEGLNWSTGVTVKWNGSLLYPNGQTLRFNENYLYPNGGNAISGSTYYYPNGSFARFAKIWKTPDGQNFDDSQFIDWICKTAGMTICFDVNTVHTLHQDIWGDLPLLEQAWALR